MRWLADWLQNNGHGMPIRVRLQQSNTRLQQSNAWLQQSNAWLQQSSVWLQQSNVQLQQRRGGRGGSSGISGTSGTSSRWRVRVRSPHNAQPRPRSQVSAAGPPRAPAAAAAAAVISAAVISAAAAAAVAADAGPGRGCIDYRSCCSAVQCCAVLRVSVRYLSVSVHCVGVPGSALCLCCSGLEKEAI
jgi:hypothetical protein